MADSTKVVEETPKDSVEVDEDSFFGWLQTKLKKKEEKRSSKDKVKGNVVAILTATWEITDNKGNKTGEKKYCSYICQEKGKHRSVETEGHQARAHSAYHKVVLPWLKGELDNTYIIHTAEVWRSPSKD